MPKGALSKVTAEVDMILETPQSRRVTRNVLVKYSAARTQLSTPARVPPRCIFDDLDYLASLLLPILLLLPLDPHHFYPF